MKYLCLVYLDERLLPELPDEDCVEFDSSIRESGHCLASEALESVHTATTVRVRNGKLSVTDTHDAGTELTAGIKPLLVIDVWEHAYYIDRKNLRPAYVDAVVDELLNWDFAAENFAREGTWTYPA